LDPAEDVVRANLAAERGAAQLTTHSAGTPVDASSGVVVGSTGDEREATGVSAIEDEPLDKARENLAKARRDVPAWSERQCETGSRTRRHWTGPSQPAPGVIVLPQWLRKGAENDLRPKSEAAEGGTASARAGRWRRRRAGGLQQRDGMPAEPTRL
jgi:hypothetical protein